VEPAEAVVVAGADPLLAADRQERDPEVAADHLVGDGLDPRVVTDDGAAARIGAAREDGCAAPGGVAHETHGEPVEPIRIDQFVEEAVLQDRVELGLDDVTFADDFTELRDDPWQKALLIRLTGRFTTDGLEYEVVVP
jgi:hypothetical protein